MGSDDASRNLPNYFYERLQIVDNGDEITCNNLYRQWPDFPWVVGQPQARREGDPLTSGYLYGEGWSILSKAKNMQQAIAWLSWMLRPANVGMSSTLRGLPAPRGEAWDYLKLSDCTREWMEKQWPYSFSSSDQYTLWQESKGVTGPQFQAAVLGEQSVEQSLEVCQEGLQKILDEKNATQR